MKVQNAPCGQKSQYIETAWQSHLATHQLLKGLKQSVRYVFQKGNTKERVYPVMPHLLQLYLVDNHHNRQNRHQYSTF